MAAQPTTKETDATPIRIAGPVLHARIQQRRLPHFWWISSPLHFVQHLRRPEPPPTPGARSALGSISPWRVDLDQRRRGCLCYGWRMSETEEHQPEEAARAAGRYEQLNVFGTPTGVVVYVADGERLPGAPRGHTWRRSPRSEGC